MFFLNSGKFKHLSQSSPNDQRASLEAAILTGSICLSERAENRILRRMCSRIHWKVELSAEILRIEREVKEALAESDRMFSFIDRIRDRITSGETGQVILDICRPMRDHKKDRGSSEAAFLVRLDQELTRLPG